MTMTQQLSSVLAGCLSLLVTVLPASSSPEADAGVQAFHAGNYALALEKLQAAARTADKNNPALHYYLAGSLSQLRRYPEAIDAYRTCLSLKPDVKTAAYCDTAIKHLTSLSFEKKDAGSKPFEPAKPPVAIIESSVKDVNQVVNVKALPAVPQFSNDEPSLASVQNWPLEFRAGYMYQCETRIQTINEQIAELQSVLRKARTVAAGQVHHRRGYGESEADFRDKQHAQERRVEEVLAPYTKAISERTRALDEARAIYEVCVAAANRFRAPLSQPITY